MLKVNVIKRYNFKIMICLLQPRPAAVTLTMILPLFAIIFLQGKIKIKQIAKTGLEETKTQNKK